MTWTRPGRDLNGTFGVLLNFRCEPELAVLVVRADRCSAGSELGFEKPTEFLEGPGIWIHIYPHTDPQVIGPTKPALNLGTGVPRSQLGCVRTMGLPPDLPGGEGGSQSSQSTSSTFSTPGGNVSPPDPKPHMDGTGFPYQDLPRRNGGYLEAFRSVRVGFTDRSTNGNTGGAPVLSGPGSQGTHHSNCKSSRR